MLRFALLFVIWLVLSCCYSDSNKGELDLAQIDLHVLSFDEYKMAPPREDYEWIFPHDFASYKPTTEEIIESERILRKNVEKFNHSNSDDKIELTQYGRQYIGVQSPSGSRYIYINCFCKPERFSQRSEYLVRVTDGGVCYFQLKITLSEWEAFDFAVNGEA